MCGPLTLLVPPEPRGPRSGRVVLSLPSSLGDRIRQSGDLCLIAQLGWLSRQSWAFEGPPAWSPHLPDFCHCTLQDCRLQLPPGVWYVRPHASAPALAIGEREATLGISNAPANQLHAGTQLRRLVRALSLRPSWLLASWAEQTERLHLLSALLRLGRPGFQPLRHPNDCRR